MNRVIGYTRVSTDQQGESGHGLDAQADTIRAYVDRQDGWELVDLLSEVGSGRTTSRRPLLAEAIQRIEAGEADGLIVAKLDRMTRSVVDGAHLVRQAEDNGWSLVALDLGIDTSTRNGRLMATVIMALGEWEADAISERTREGLAAARDRGVTLGRPREMPQSTVDAIYELREKGLRQSDVADELNRRGIAGPRGGTWVQSMVSDVERRYS